MKPIVLLTCILCLTLGSAQDYEPKKISVGFNVSAIGFTQNFAVKTMENSRESKDFYTGKGDPIVALGVFGEYHILNHSVGVGHQTAIYDYEYHQLSYDLIVPDNTDKYTLLVSDYTTYTFSNLSFYYKYTFLLSNFQPSLKLGTCYHNVSLNGYSSVSIIENGYNNTYYVESSDSYKIQYWSIKPEVNFAYRISEHISSSIFLGYDVALGESMDYKYNYDQELIDTGFLNKMARSYTPGDYLEIGANIEFLFF